MDDALLIDLKDFTLKNGLNNSEEFYNKLDASLLARTDQEHSDLYQLLVAKYPQGDLKPLPSSVYRTLFAKAVIDLTFPTEDYSAYSEIFFSFPVVERGKDEKGEPIDLMRLATVSFSNLANAKNTKYIKYCDELDKI